MFKPKLYAYGITNSTDVWKFKKKNERIFNFISYIDFQPCNSTGKQGLHLLPWIELKWKQVAFGCSGPCH